MDYLVQNSNKEQLKIGDIVVLFIRGKLIGDPTQFVITELPMVQMNNSPLYGNRKYWCYPLPSGLSTWFDDRDYTWIKISSQKSSVSCICKRCNSSNPFAEPNQKDGSYICFECR